MRRKKPKRCRKSGKNIFRIGIGKRQRRKRYSVNELLSGVTREKMDLLKSMTAEAMEGGATGCELG